jgi:cellulose synthase/poly-beta-1,6-N-acetylglucosamine synthase-like glycosyltransferase
MQGWEWLFLNLLWNAADERYPISAIGNNMAFPAESYWKTGGYENHPFSVTEDYQLFLLLQAQGLRHRHLLLRECLAFSAPLSSYSEVLRQRRRWLRGGAGMRWWVWGVLGAYSLFLPLCAWLAWLLPWTAAGFMALQLCLVITLLWMGSRHLRLRFSVGEALLFVPYLLMSNVLVLLYFFLPGRVRWKGRAY